MSETGSDLYMGGGDLEAETNMSVLGRYVFAKIVSYDYVNLYMYVVNHYLYLSYIICEDLRNVNT